MVLTFFLSFGTWSTLFLDARRLRRGFSFTCGFALTVTARWSITVHAIMTGHLHSNTFLLLFPAKVGGAACLLLTPLDH